MSLCTSMSLQKLYREAIFSYFPIHVFVLHWRTLCVYLAFNIASVATTINLTLYETDTEKNRKVPPCTCRRALPKLSVGNLCVQSTNLDKKWRSEIARFLPTLWRNCSFRDFHDFAHSCFGFRANPKTWTSTVSVRRLYYTNSYTWLLYY